MTRFSAPIRPSTTNAKSRPIAILRDADPPATLAPWTGLEPEGEFRVPAAESNPELLARPPVPQALSTNPGQGVGPAPPESRSAASDEEEDGARPAPNAQAVHRSLRPQRRGRFRRCGGRPRPAAASVRPPSDHWRSGLPMIDHRGREVLPDRDRSSTPSGRRGPHQAGRARPTVRPRASTVRAPAIDLLRLVSRHRLTEIRRPQEGRISQPSSPVQSQSV